MKRLLLLSVLVLAGCASTAGHLQLATAQHVGQTAPADVAVSQVHRSATMVEWIGTTPQGRYACMADDMVRRVVCTQKP